MSVLINAMVAIIVNVGYYDFNYSAVHFFICGRINLESDA